MASITIFTYASSDAAFQGKRLFRGNRLIASPRKSSASRMYNDRWLRFAGWGGKQGIDLLDLSGAQIAFFLHSLLRPMAWLHKWSRVIGLASCQIIAVYWQGLYGA